MTIKQEAENDNLNKITRWGYNYLVSHGYTLKSNTPKAVQNTPWSYVTRFTTSSGYIYLKHTPKLLALEAEITQILHDRFHASVPAIIANNTELNCFLMKDAGRPLREILKKNFDITLLCQAIDKFTSLQLAVADHINILLDIGVPDWQLDKLYDLYKQLLSQKDILIDDGLSEKEIDELELLLPTVYSLCKRLSDYSIKQTLVQPDFHDNNVLINDISQKITIIDLGEIVISHPFFSLVNCLQQIKKHHVLTDEDHVYQQLVDAALKNFMPFESRKNLLDAFVLARISLFIYGALAHYRLMVACDKTRLRSFQGPGKLSVQLKEFIIACSAL